MMPRPPKRIAAIDIGTVTTRLLVADVEAPGRVTEVYRSVDITHLGEGLPATGELSLEAMDRVGAVLAEYVRRLAETNVGLTVVAATSASRDASNSDEFRTVVESKGLDLSIISGEDEAELSFAGATYGRSGDGLLVVDIGGGSTELVLGNATENERSITCAQSVDVGSRRITEMFLHDDPPTEDQIEEAREYVRMALEDFFEGCPMTATEAISVAGTATTLSAIEMSLDPYVADRIEGTMLATTGISFTMARLASLPLDERKRVVGLHPERAYVIISGAIILEEVLGLAGLSSTTVSERDILYGMLLDAYRRSS